MFVAFYKNTSMTKDHSMKTFKSKCGAPSIVNLGMRWKLQTLASLSITGKKPMYTFDRGAWQPTSWFGLGDRAKTENAGLKI
jgi:hypothetical protein